MNLDEFEIALSKIRPHTTSKQRHQQKPAQLLVALESTLKETYLQSSLASTSSDPTQPNPTAYFGAILTTLESCISANDENGLAFEEGDTLPAVLYLLALVVPFVPHPVIRTHLSNIFQYLPSLLPHTIPDHAPPLRSLITIFGTVMTAMDQNQLQKTITSSQNISSTSTISATSTITTIRQTFSTLLELVIDPRPKVRKRAAEVIKDILESPPSPLLVHPWGKLVAEWSCGIIASGTIGAGGRGDGVERIIHLLSFLRTVPFIFSSPSSNTDSGGTLETITRYLILMPKMSNPYLTQAAYQLLSTLLSTSNEDDDEYMDEESSGKRQQQAQIVLKTLPEYAPPKPDTILTPFWLSAVAQATVASHGMVESLSPLETPAEVYSMIELVWGYFDRSSSATRQAVEESLCTIIYGNCISLEDLCGYSGGLIPVVDMVLKGFSSIAYASSMEEIFAVITALAEASSPLYTGLPEGTSPAELHAGVKSTHPLLRLLDVVVGLRATDGFEHKAAVDKFLSALMRAVGVDGVLDRAPLGLLPNER